MVIRPCEQPKSTAKAWQIIEPNPRALLVSNGDDGSFVINLPLLREPAASTSIEKQHVLINHVSRATSTWHSCRAAPSNVLALFEWPSSFVMASWYLDRQMPSTYYCTAVHCYGWLECQSMNEVDNSREDLTQRMEAHHPDDWHTSKIPCSEIVQRLFAIVGFRFLVERMEAKFKLGQDESCVMHWPYQTHSTSIVRQTIAPWHV